MPIDSLITAAQQQRNFIAGLPERYTSKFSKKTITRDRLLRSIDLLLEKLQEYPSTDQLSHFIREHYDIYQAGGRTGKACGEMLVTGYFEPLFEARLKKGGKFIWPIYRKPDSLLTFPKAELAQGVGRLNGSGQPVPYWSRAQIETQNLLAGNELAFLADPVDAFLLHVQGSGRLRLANGKQLPIHFAGSNGLEYKSIGKHLVEQKIMSLEEVSVPAIRGWLKTHPDQIQKLLHHNPRYIFFSWGKGKHPRGSTGVELTPGRSIATDREVLPGVAIGYLTTQKPIIDGQGQIIDWAPLHRFVFPQDSGAAIEGPGRVDMFWGSGAYAKSAAGAMHEEGKLFFLLLKDSL